MRHYTLDLFSIYLGGVTLPNVDMSPFRGFHGFGVRLRDPAKVDDSAVIE